MSADLLNIAMIRRDRIDRGLCPSCGARIAHWIAPDPSSDTWRVLHDRDGRDPATGHLLICPEK